MKDPATEQWLTNKGYTWTYHENVPFSEIDIKQSQENPSRFLRKVDDEIVLRYGMAMEAGDQFPAIVLLTLDPETSPLFKYLIATGVHRWSAADAIQKLGLDAYVVIEADTYRREALCRGINNINGKGVTQRDSILQLLALNDAYPGRATLAQLAAAWNLKEGTVRSVQNELNAEKRAAVYGFALSPNPKAKVGMKHLILLNGIRPEPVYAKAVNYIQNHQPVAGELDTMVRAIKKCRDEASAIAVIDKQIAEENAVAVKSKVMHGRSPLVPAVKFRSDCKRLSANMEGGVERLQIPSYPHRKDLAILVNELIDQLKRVSGELARIERIEKTAPVRSDIDARPAVH